VVGFLKRLFNLGSRPIDYQEARDLAAHEDPMVRAELASRTDVKPEILYFLAEDSDVTVRRRVATNQSSPPQADLLLSKDEDLIVRQGLAEKISRLAPGLTPHEQDRLRRLTYETLDTLARDQVDKVRIILAETLRDVADAPPDVIRRLARDAEIAVSAPVLQYSPVLSDEDLLEIIGTGPIPGALSAISRRSTVNMRVADAIAGTDDEDAICQLLGNPSAQIREETLDRLIDRSVDIESWHKPLVQRPQLPGKAANKLARFVAANLLESLAKRNDLEPDAAVAVAAIVRRRLDEIGKEGVEKSEAHRATDENAALIRAQQMRFQNKLDESTIDTALSGGDNAFVMAALSVLAGLTLPVVRKTVDTQSVKGIVAVSWKAGLSVSFCEQLQLKLLRLPSSRIMRGKAGEYPLQPPEMEWQLEFLSD